MNDDPLADEYDALPIVIKQYYSFREYCWMPADARANLMRTETQGEA